VQRLDAARQRQPHQQAASGRMTNCGSITPLMISGGQHAALFARFGHLHQSVGPAGSGMRTQI
jgi:hypothetical protein